VRKIEASDPEIGVLQRPVLHFATLRIRLATPNSRRAELPTPSNSDTPKE